MQQGFYEASYSFVIGAHAQEPPREAPAVPPAQPTRTPAVASASPQRVEEVAGEENYKTARLREMAALWKGTTLEPHTVRLLAMLLQEDGTLTAERRHDCHGGTCYAVGFMGHNICQRGTPIIYQNAGEPFKKFCGKGAMAKFEAAYPAFATDWREQFREYTLRAKGAMDDGVSVSAFIRSWNYGEGTIRLTRVASHEAYVRAALGL